MKRFILCLIYILSYLGSFSQTTIHLDKPYYFAGEYIFYSFCNGNLPDKPVVALIELFDKNSRVESYYVPITDQCGNGYLKLSYDLPTGLYVLEISAHEQNTFNRQSLASITLPIYNDEDLELLEAKAGENITLSLDFTADLNRYESLVNRKSKVLLTMDIPPQFRQEVNHVSISVRDFALYQSHSQTMHVEVMPANDLPLMEGIPLLGFRNTINHGPIQSLLLFAYNPSNLHFDGTKVNEGNNEFKLEIDPFYEKQQISFLDYVGNTIQIKEQITTRRPEINDEWTIDRGIIEHLKTYQEEKQINRIFKQVATTVKIDSNALINQRSRPSFYIDVQDYTIRGTSADLFKELSTNLKFRSAGKEKFKARMLYEHNGITKFYSRPPLFLVNDRATRDGDFIANIPLQEIGFFTIYSDYQQLEDLSPMAHGGIVYIDMIDQHYELPDDKALPSLSVQGLQIPLLYPIQPVVDESFPTVGSLLYWHPSYELGDDPAIHIELQSIDITTDYLVEVVLHLKEAGKTEMLRQILKVRNP